MLRRLLALAFAIGAPGALHAQSPDWSSTLTIQPFPSPYLSDWERVPSTALLTVTYTGSAATDYVVRGTLTSTQRGFVGTIESPITSLPGGPSTSLFNARDAILDWTTIAKNTAITDPVLRTGTIPEGRYRACATVLQGTARTPVSEACADFTILLPDPPQLITPLQGSEVLTAQPFFSWTPVIAPPDIGLGYRIKVVEVIGTQTPIVALQANIPLLDEVVADAPFLLYPLNGVMLESGKRYAWQVRATDASGRQLFRDNVESEIHTFVMGADLLTPVTTLAQLGDEAIIQPGVAVLRGLSRAQVRQDLASGGWAVNGTLDLVLLGLPGQPSTPVTVRDLLVGRRGSDIVMASGSLVVSRPSGQLLPRSANGLARVRELRASPSAGVTAAVDIVVPGQGTLPLDGTFQLTGLGWYGRREGMRRDSTAFATVGRAQVQVALTKARFDLPAGALELGGRLRILGSTAACEDFWARADDGVLRSDAGCRAAGTIPLSKRGPTDFKLDALAGRVTADILADTVGFSLSALGRFRLFGERGPACHVEALLELAPGKTAVKQQNPRCDRQTAVQDVSKWLRLRYEILRVDSLAQVGDSTFWFKLGFQADPELVAAPAFDMPAFVNAYATPDSIVMPALPGLYGPDVPGDIDQFRITWRRAEHPAIAQPWSAWNPTADSLYRWKLTANANFEPDHPGANECVVLRFPLSAADTAVFIGRGRVTWTAKRADYNPGCKVNLSASLTAVIYRTEGPVVIRLDSTATAETLPLAAVDLNIPKWPAPVHTAEGSLPPFTIPPIEATEALLGGLLQTQVAADVQQMVQGTIGDLVNGILDGAGVCGLLRDVPVDVRGHFYGSATIKKGCDVALGIGKLLPYTGRFEFGPGSVAGQPVVWKGGARISLDSTLTGHDDLVAAANKPVADSLAKVKADSIAKADSAKWASDPTYQQFQKLQAQYDSLDRRSDSLGALGDSLKKVDETSERANAAYEQQGLTIKQISEVVKPKRDSVKAVWDSTLKARTKADSLAKVATSTAGAVGVTPSVTSDSLPPPKASEADDPAAEIDWNTGRVLKGKWTIKGPFVVQPIAGLAFRVRNAVLDTAGLAIDGSHPVLYLKSTDSSATQWTGVKLDLVSRQFRAGVVTFGTGFGMEMGTSDTLTTAGVSNASGFWATGFEVAKLAVNAASLAFSVGNWRVRPPGGSAAIVNGLRVEATGQPFFDMRGLNLRGQSPVRGQFLGDSSTSMRLEYSNDFALRSWTQVSQGRATLVVNELPIAYWDPTGWHPAVAELVATVIPKRLPLPTEAVAYIQLRDETSDKLLVNVQDAGNNTWRMATLAPVSLVVPALKGALGGTAPSAKVSFDLVVDKTTFALQQGSIVTSVKGVPGFDLSAGGLPFAIDTLRYDKGAGATNYRLTLEAALALIGEASPTGRARITVDGNGNFGGDVVMPVRRTLDLGSPEVQLLVDALTGTIRGSVAQGLDFRIDARGGVRLALQGQQPWSIAATLRLSPTGAEFVDVQQEAIPVLRLGSPAATFLLGNPRLPLLAWDPVLKKVRFDLLFDLGVEIPALSNVAFPTIKDIHVRETGLEIPAFEIAEISSQMLADGAFGQRATGPVQAAGFSVRPLALRVGRFTWNFGSVPAPPDVRLDVELGLAAPAGPPPDDLSSFKVRVLDLGWRDNALRGNVEPVQWVQGIRTPFGSLRSAWGTFAVGAQSEAHIFVGADIRLPDIFKCAEGTVAPIVAAQGAKDTLEFLPTGAVRGTVTNFVPNCSGALGPVAFKVLGSRIAFTAGPNQPASVLLDGSMRVALATGTGSDSVRADGRLAVNLVTGEITDASVEINQAFNWQPDPRNPIVNFTVQRARLDRTGIIFTGGGQLRLTGGGGAALTFNDLAYGFREQRFTGGSATVQTDLALGAELNDAGMLWGAFPASAPRGTGPGFRLVLPAGIVIDGQGVAINGTATASLSFGDSTFQSLSVGFEDGFRLATSGQFRVTSGAARLRRATDLIAWIDSTGFRPGNIFGILPIPERLALPSPDVAYLVLGSGQTRYVQMATENGQTHLRTAANTTVDLVMPGLARGGAAPVVKTAFDLVVDPRTMKVVGGALQVDAPAGQSLVPLPDLPIDLTRLGFKLGTDGWQFRVSARARLPGALAATPLVFENMLLTPQGLSGTIEIGQVTDTYRAGMPAVASASLLGDSLRIAFTGARLELTAGQAPTVAVAGTITSAVLKNEQGQAAPLFLRGRVSPTSFEAAADLSALGAAGIPLGIAELRPTTPSGGAPLRFVADARNAALEFGASIVLTDLAPGLTIAVDTIHIGSDGLRVSPLSVSNGNAVQFELFGLQFALRDSLVGGSRAFPALAGRFDGSTLQLEMTGDVTILENTTRFTGLKVGTDGTLALAGVSLISRPIYIVPERFFLDTLALANGKLRAAAGVLLPAPLDVGGAAQRVFMTIAPDGQVSGGGTVVLIKENEGLATADKKIDLGIATFHLRYLAATLDFERPRERTSVDLVSDIYIANNPDNLLRLGSISGGVINSGLRISLAGVNWSGIEVVRPISVDIGPVRLTVTSATAQIGARGLAASMSGKLGLTLEMASGGLSFQNVRLTEDGEIRLGDARIDGGMISITDMFMIDVRNLGFSDTLTTISVPNDNSKPTGRTATVPAQKMVQVNSYLSFSASASIAKVFTGGVRRVLVYEQASDGTTHIFVDSLGAKVSDVFEVVASMRYDEYPDGFAMQVAGRALIMGGTQVSMAGVIGQRSGVVRAGLFLATSVNITIIPGVVTLTGVGGGFFINPEPSDLVLVREVAGITGRPAQNMGPPPAAKFAIMLYAQMVGFGAGDAALVGGQVLLTVTDQAFRLDGNVVMLGQKNSLYGDIALQVGWAPQAYLLGDIDLNVKLDSAAVGNARFQFAVGGNAFAVKGNVELTVLKVLKAQAEIVIVPSGFMTSATVKIEQNFWVVKVSASLMAQIWFRPSTNDLGMYTELKGAAEIPGLIGIEAYLRGALIVAPKFMIFMAGGGRAYVLGAEAKIQFWLSISESGFGGGLGENAELNDAIARAQQVAAEIRAEADSIIRAVQNMTSSLTASPVVASEATLARIMTNAAGWAASPNWAGFLLITFAAGSEGIYDAGVGKTTYFGTYWNLLTQQSAPKDTAAIVAIRADAERKLRILSERRDEMLARIAALQAAVDSVRSVTMPEITSPVKAFRVSDATVAASTTTAAGGERTAATLSNVPVFDLDDAMSAANKAAMTRSASEAEARRGEVVRALAQAQASLDSVRSALSATQSSSLMGYLRLWADAVEATEHQHASTVDYVMRRWSWARDGARFVRDSRSAFQRYVDSVSTSIVNKTNLAVGERVLKLEEVSKIRVQLIGGLGQDPTLASRYETFKTNAAQLGNDLKLAAWKQQADTLAMQLYSRAALLGLEALDSVLRVEATNTAAAATAAVQRVRASHAEMSARTAVVSDAQLELYGAMYDLYDAMLREIPATDTLAAGIRARRDAISPLLQAPQIGSVVNTVQDLGYMSKVTLDWTATHPVGVPEYTVNDGDGLVRSLGGRGLYTTWRWSTDLAGGGAMFMAQIGARGAGGTRTARATPQLGITFKEGSQTQPYTTSYTGLTQDVTPPSVVTIRAPKATTVTTPEGMLAAWVTRGEMVELAWSASDAESGIIEYKYRVVQRDPPGTPLTLNVTYPVTRTSLTSDVELVPWTSLGGRTTMLLAAPSPAAGKVAMVEIKAINGASLEGNGGGLILREDTSGPTAPANTFLGVAGAGTRAAAGSAPTVVAAACEVPTANLNSARTALINSPTGPSVTGTLTVGKPAFTDTESGIVAWYAKFGDAPETAVTGEGWIALTDTAGLALRIPNVPYEVARYLSVSARNGAGAFGKPVTTAGPVRLYDPTPAPAPVFCVTGGTSSIAVRATTLSRDPESGILGYQVRLRTTSGAVVRDWPAGTTVDLPATLQYGVVTPVPTVSLVAGQLVAEMRAVNGGGVPGHQAASGPIAVDLTPPPTPTFTGATIVLGKGGVFQVSATVVSTADPESGFGGVEVQVIDGDVTQFGFQSKGEPAVLVPWTRVANPVAGTGTYLIGLPQLPEGPFTVSVRALNGSGVGSTVVSRVLSQ